MNRLGAFRTAQQPAATTTSPAAEAVETQDTQSVIDVVEVTEEEAPQAEAPVVAATTTAPAIGRGRLGAAGVATRTVPTPAPTAGKGRLGAAKTTVAAADQQDSVDTTEDASVTRGRPLVMLGSAKARKPAEERVIQLGDRMPINMVHDAFHDYLLNSDQIDASSMTKKDTTTIFKLVEDFMADMVSKHPVQFMSFLYRHKPVAERFYAPRISDFVTYVGPHVQIEAKSNIAEPLKAFLMETPEGMKAFSERVTTKVVDGVETTVTEKVQDDDLQYLVDKFLGQNQQ